MTQAFLYKWTHKLSKKWYIGSRTAKNCHINDGRVNQYSANTKNRKGHIPWNKGKCVRLNPEYEFKEGNTPWNKGLPAEKQPGYGYKHTSENKELFSEQKLGNKNPMYGKTPWNKGIKGKKWFNNGELSKQYFPGKEPIGFVIGRLQQKINLGD